MKDNNNHLTRHSLFSRVLHWLMAGCILILVATGILPILKINFEWVTPHWIAGVFLTVAVLIHIFRSLSPMKIKSMWISFSDLKEFVECRGKVRGGKYSLEQKLMHHGITLFSLVSLVTGWLLLLKIDTPIWEKNPFIFEASTWGIIYLFSIIVQA